MSSKRRRLHYYGDDSSSEESDDDTDNSDRGAEETDERSTSSSEEEDIESSEDDKSEDETVTVVVQRFSEAEHTELEFDKNASVAEVLDEVKRELELEDSHEEVDLYRKFKRLENEDTLEEAIDVHEAPVHINVSVTAGERRLPKRLRENDTPDMINPWDDDDRYLMPCGHAITPDNLYRFCWNELEEKRTTEFRCPAVEGDELQKCNKKWNFKNVARGACLSLDEINLFVGFLNQNWFNLKNDLQLCPKCGEAIQGSPCRKNRMECVYCKTWRGNFKFCIICTRPWIKRFSSMECGNKGCSSMSQKSVVKATTRKTIVGVKSCPSVRACPNCRYVIKHTGLCKHVECPTCHTDFCFICLKKKPIGDLYWPCGGAFEKCKPAPIQKTD